MQFNNKARMEKVVCDTVHNYIDDAIFGINLKLIKYTNTSF